MMLARSLHTTLNDFSFHINGLLAIFFNSFSFQAESFLDGLAAKYGGGGKASSAGKKKTKK